MTVALSRENPILACVRQTTAIHDSAAGKERTISRRMASILAEHGQEMLRRARRILRLEADADDAVQEVMLSIFRRPRVLETVERIRPWLLGLVHRRCVDLIRSERRRREVEAGTSLESLFAEIDPAELAERDDLCSAIARAVDALPRKLRWVVVKNELEEMTFREISRESGVPMGTLMAWKARAVALLRRKLR